MDFNAKDYGIELNKDVTKEINSLLINLKDIEEDKVLILEKGTYFLTSRHAVQRKLYITNTIGKNEWKKDEIPQMNKIGLDLRDLNNLTVKGNGAVFVIDGQITNMVIENCKNVKLKDITIKTVNPDMHDLRVVKKSLFSVDFSLDSESKYIFKNRKPFFVGKDYETPFKDSLIKAFWIGMLDNNHPNRLKRTGHPLMGCYSFKEIGTNLFRAKYLIPQSKKTGDVFCLFDVRRKFAGIFVDNSKDIILDNIEQNFNYSLAYVAQNSENLYVLNCKFRPEKVKIMSSVADFMQICMCRGEVRIENNIFDGSGDDCLNAHGIHFKIIEKDENNNKIKVKFMHRQSLGFNPLRKGDRIKMIYPDTLLSFCESYIVDSVMTDEFTIELTLKDAKDFTVGNVIEDVSACCDLYFINNSLNRIITRGILVTNGGKNLVKNNKFLGTEMSAVLVSDDAKNWYECGRVLDLTVENNFFGDCPSYTLMIKPENSVHLGYVHKNIKFINNIVESGKGFYIKSAEKCLITNNKIRNKKSFKIINSNVEVNDNNA